MKKYIFYLVLFGFFFQGCKKQEGCTDASAINYDALAESENGTCKYCDTYESTLLGLVLKNENPNNFLLEVLGLGDVKMEKGCEVVIDLGGLSSWLPSAEMQWSPAEIYDCPTCSKVTLQPKESVEFTLKINSPEGYYFEGSFNAWVLE